jgi:hypothetical protein
VTNRDVVPNPEDLLFTPFLRRRKVEVLDRPGKVLFSKLKELWKDHDLSEQRIAITIGSRGISNRVELIRAVVDLLKEKGAKPFALNAMGSHGGASADGQMKVMNGLGFTEESLGCPLECSMDVVEIDEEGEGPVTDKLALNTDGVVVFNRIKPHTSFSGNHESGLVKMLVVGLGKAEGARRIHRLGPTGLRDTMPIWGKKILSKLNVIGAIGVVENPLDQVMSVEVSGGDGLMDLDANLLKIARPQLPSLPVDKTDVLLIDQMGKDISGTGMDTNVIGRLLIHGLDEPDSPKIGRIVVHNLTDASGGNGTGVGLADVVGPRIAEKYNRDITQKNVLTTGFIQRAKLPFTAQNDREALSIALASLHGVSSPSILRIQDTLHLDHFWAHGPIVNELIQIAGVEMAGDPASIYESNEQLSPFFVAG